MLPTLLAAAALTLTGPQVGAPAPDFHLTTLGGKAVSLKAFAGKTLVLNDWATWCPPCRAETPDLIAAAKKLTKSGDVVLLGVDSTEQAPIVRAFVTAKGVPYDQAIDADKAFATAFHVDFFPSTFVIGPDGVLRAKSIGNLDGATLASLVADAQAGRNGEVRTAAQKEIDALLDPAKFSFTGDAAAVRASAKAVSDAIDKAENVDGTSDYARTQAEENVLRDAAIAALAPVATTTADKVLVARLRGDAATAREQWSDALAAYNDALTLAPGDDDLSMALAQTYGRLKDYDHAIPLYAAFAQKHPSANAYITLASTQDSAGRTADAEVSYAQAIAAARVALAAKPNDEKGIRALAGAYLNDAGVLAKLGKTAQARDAYRQTIAYASRLPKTNERYAIDNERAQEGLIALASHARGGATSLSLAPWTGDDLPGSIASTYKYRLIVTGAPGKSVALAASGLPKHWIASFCSDRQCAPFRTTVALPESGVKIIEFQLVPESKLRAPATVHVTGGGASTAVTVAA